MVAIARIEPLRCLSLTDQHLRTVTLSNKEVSELMNMM